MAYLNLGCAIFWEEMCRDLDAAGFAKNTGIPMDMSRIFASLAAQEIGADRVKNRSI